MIKLINQKKGIVAIFVITILLLQSIQFLALCNHLFLTQTDTCLKFDFGPGNQKEGYIKISKNSIYNQKSGYGFVSENLLKEINYDGGDDLTTDFITSSNPFYFVVDLPEGNYKVRVILGDSKGKSKTTIKAESRRLMVKEVSTDIGEFKTESFIVNVRTPYINKEKSIKRKSRELTYLNWDNKLTLEFNNERPCICGVEIKKVEDCTTIYLTGNSTVVDQEREPWAAWGQMLPNFFDNNVVIANYAESGEAMKSFIAENRLLKISNHIKKDDYLFIQFGHNDQKPQSSAYLEPFTGYKEYLKIFINEARSHGAIPVLITSMKRRSFDEKGVLINTHGDYPEAVRQVAKEENVPLIDLNVMSKVFYEALGVENSKKAFVHYPAGSFPGQTEDFKDNSHHSTYGAYQLAKCIVQGIKDNNLDLVNHLVDNLPEYDPASPDPFEKWDLPISPLFEAIKPDGN